jgi:hypothetical protein
MRMIAGEALSALPEFVSEMRHPVEVPASEQGHLAPPADIVYRHLERRDTPQKPEF